MANKILVSNRKAHADYALFEPIEAGIELKGSEVKSLREGKGNLRDSFARIENDQVFLYNCHISPYSHKGYDELNPLRVRKLLLHKRQITKLEIEINQRGFTFIPLKLYLSKGLVKVELALAKGKKHYDKRAAIKKREQDLAIRRAMRHKY